MSRLYNITQEEVRSAWKAVRKAGGGCGYDRRTLEDTKCNLDNELYKIWNRMTSGSYIPKHVLQVAIPKAKGGVRILGIPTVGDRIAQMVIKQRLEPILERYFHADSYAYRPNKSAIDAVTACRERCFQFKWLIELDIQKFFDELDHDLLEQMVLKYTDDPTIILYVKKFLKATRISMDGEVEATTQGTPQGGVVSPLLANLFLHEVFDTWMVKEFSTLPFERYADDIVVHCTSERQAQYLRKCIEERLRAFKLTLHPEKTRIVYTGRWNDYDHRGHDVSRKFTFLGYDFKPRTWNGKVVYTPGMGKGALKRIRSEIKDKWRLRSRISESLHDIAHSVNPAIRGWINYYGHFRRSELSLLTLTINGFLAKFLKKKHKRLRTWNQAWKEVMKIRRTHPNLFYHWHGIS